MDTRTPSLGRLRDRDPCWSTGPATPSTRWDLLGSDRDRTTRTHYQNAPATRSLDCQARTFDTRLELMPCCLYPLHVT